MKLGDVEIMPFEGGEDIAQFVAFAASVKSYTSSPHAVQSIGAVNGPDREVIFRLRRAGRLRGYGDSAFNCPLKHCGWLAISGR